MATPRKKKATIQDVYDRLGELVPIPLPPTVPPSPPPTPCSCCFDCTGMAKGTIFYCDGNGGCMALPPPASNAALKFNLITGTVYWNPEE